MKLDANSFKVFEANDYEDVYRIANDVYRSDAIDYRLSSSQRVAQAYVDAVLTVAINKGVVSLLKKGKEHVTDITSIMDE